MNFLFTFPGGSNINNNNSKAKEGQQTKRNVPCSSPAPVPAIPVCPCGCGDEEMEHRENYVIRKAQTQMVQFIQLFLKGDICVYLINLKQESLCEISRWFREEQQKSGQDSMDRTESGGNFSSFLNNLFNSILKYLNYRRIIGIFDEFSAGYVDAGAC